MKRFVLTFAAVMNLLLADQFVKALAVARLKGGPAVTVWAGVFDLSYVENRGCAWGLFQGQVWPLAAFGLVALAVLIVKRRQIFPKGCCGVIAELTLYAGILGNLIDRLYFGCVIDLFDFHWGVHHFPCFNVADVYINIAAGLLILTAFFQKREKGAEETA